MTLQELLNKNLEKNIDWPEKVKVLAAADISRDYPMRQGAQKCLTGHASDTFLHGRQSCLAYDTFRIAFLMAVADFKDQDGKPYRNMGPFNDDGNQTEEQIAEIFNNACALVGYENGKKAA